MNHVAKFNASTSALDKIAEQEALEQFDLEIDESLINSLRVEVGSLPHYHAARPVGRIVEAPVMLNQFHNSYENYWNISFQDTFAQLRNHFEQALSTKIVYALKRINTLNHPEAVKIVVIGKDSERAFVIGDNNDIYNLEGDSLLRLHGILARAEPNRPLKARRRTKYTLDQLLAECDETAPMPEEFKDWDNMGLVGLERGEGI